MNGQPAPRPGTGLPSVITLGQDRPDVSRTAFIAPGAVLIGRVTIGGEASVWYGAVLRADRDTVSVGDRSNVQDGCVMHADPGVPLSVGSDVTIGHNATLHGCTIEDLVLIGMGAIVLNRARGGVIRSSPPARCFLKGNRSQRGCWWPECRARSGVTCPRKSTQRSSATPPRT